MLANPSYRQYNVLFVGCEECELWNAGGGGMKPIASALSLLVKGSASFCCHRWPFLSMCLCYLSIWKNSKGIRSNFPQVFSGPVLLCLAPFSKCVYIYQWQVHFGSGLKLLISHYLLYFSNVHSLFVKNPKYFVNVCVIEGSCLGTVGYLVWI